MDKVNIMIGALTEEDKHAIFLELLQEYPVSEPTHFFHCVKCDSLGYEIDQRSDDSKFFVCNQCDKEFCNLCEERKEYFREGYLSKFSCVKCLSKNR
jgi:hypothetical protein